MIRTLTIGLLAVAALSAADKVAPINADRTGVALGGYDAVAYFTSQQPVKGSEAYTHSWMGATWRFASAANRDRFAAAPANFAPQFGGYCAWAVSNNYTAPVDPLAWKIVDGKLYLNYSRAVQRKWEQDLTQRIKAGETNWPSLHR